MKIVYTSCHNGLVKTKNLLGIENLGNELKKTHFFPSFSSSSSTRLALHQGIIKAYRGGRTGGAGQAFARPLSEFVTEPFLFILVKLLLFN